MKIRITAALLLLAMALTAFGCASGDNSVSSDNTADTTTADTTTVAETADPYDDELEAYNFDGDEMHFYSRWTASIHGELNVAEETGDVLKDAIYRRNRMLEERFNFVLTETSNNKTDPARTAVLAGDDSFDVITTRCSYAYDYAAEGIVIPVQDLPVINLDKPYWDAKLTGEMTVLGEKYFAVGDFNLTGHDFTHILLFNKAVVKNYGFGDIYSTVKDGSWTLAKYAEMGKAVIKDLDGNGTMDKNDSYGILITGKQILPNLWISAGLTSITKDSNDTPTFTLTNNEKFVSHIDNIFRIHWDDGLWMPSQTTQEVDEEHVQMFSNNQSLFLDCSFFHVARLRSMETDFGIIPYPKYDDKQEQYYSRIEGCELFCVPVTNKTLEFTGAVLEAMASESAKSVIPAYYDIALQGKITRDEESSEMLDLIFETRVFDWGDTIWCNHIRDGIFDDMMKANDRDLASKTAALEALVENQIKTTVEMFEKLG